MQALGLIETRGLVAAVEGADAMLKAAEVMLLEKTVVGGGLISITVAGDVGAVKAAVDAGASAVEQLNKKALVSRHVIPRPHESLEEIIILEKPLSDAENIPVSAFRRTLVRGTYSMIENNVNIMADLSEAESMNLIKADTEVEERGIVQEIKAVVQEEDTIQETEKDEEKKNAASENALIEVRKEDLDEQMKKSGVETGMELLNDINVQMLRKLANEYEDFTITSEFIAKANKKQLLTEFKKYYGQRQ